MQTNVKRFCLFYSLDKSDTQNQTSQIKKQKKSKNQNYTHRSGIGAMLGLCNYKTTQNEYFIVIEIKDTFKLSSNDT